MDAKHFRIASDEQTTTAGSRDLQTAEVELREGLGRLERDWILGRLLAQSGVADAEWSDEDGRSLVVEYDARRVTGAELVNFLYVCGLPTRSAARRR